MHHLLGAESVNDPFLFQKYELQLYDIRSHMLHFYDRIKDLDLSTMAESNLPGLYEIFSELDDLVHLDVAEDLCQTILRDPLIRSLLPVVYASYTRFFSLHETHLAREILDCKDPWGMLKSFPLYSRYEDMLKTHVQNSPKMEVLAFIGCGPLPVTLLILSKLYGIRCIGVDKDPEAVALAKSCVKHFGLEKEINIVEGDENILAEFDWDSVLVAGLAEPKERIFENLHSIIKNRNPSPEKSISVCYRNYTGMRQLLYWPVHPEQIKGFRKITEIHPSGKVNNTLVFLECV